MSQSVTFLVIQADQTSIAELKEAIEPLPDARVQTQQIQAQVGDPNTWILTAQLAAIAISSLSTMITALIQRNKIGYFKIGDAEFRNVTANDVERVIESLEGYTKAT
ncbi:MAG: hypothetical protein AB7P69_27490 [Candidatus Binatia bacterium]